MKVKAPVKTADLLREETILDEMFSEAREEVEESLDMTEEYGFVVYWKSDFEPATEEEIELEAVERLYRQSHSVSQTQSEKIERFCLPILSASGSRIAIEKSLSSINERPHLAQLYCSYLTRACRY